MKFILIGCCHYLKYNMYMQIWKVSKLLVLSPSSKYKVERDKRRNNLIGLPVVMSIQEHSTVRVLFLI